MNFPVSQHTAEWFLYYLSEPWAIEQAGGKDYIMDIFQGLGVVNG
jgi:hypothetical protein